MPFGTSLHDPHLWDNPVHTGGYWSSHEYVLIWVSHFDPTRDEQYRIMWNELETLVRAHVNSSDKHQRVMECLQACRSKPPEEEERKKRGRKREDKEEKSDKGSKDYDHDKKWTESER